MSDPYGGGGEPGARLFAELSMLMDAVAERAGPWLDRVAAGDPSDCPGDCPRDRPRDADGAESDEPVGADGSAAGAEAGCRWCPVCAVLAVLRGERSELAARGVDQLADLVALLRAVLADRWEPGVPHMPGFTPRNHDADSDGADSADRADGTRSDGSGSWHDSRRRVQRIVVRREQHPMGDD